MFERCLSALMVVGACGGCGASEELPPISDATTDASLDIGTETSTKPDAVTDSTRSDTPTDSRSLADADGDVSTDASEAGCATGITETEACGKCGSRQRVCEAGGWLPWGPCTGEGVCSPGDKTSFGCGKCGKRAGSCSSKCSWDLTACADEGVCAPLTSETTTSSCASGKSSSRVCGESCTWGAWGACTASGWRDMSLPPAEFPGRAQPSYAWTGTQLLLYGGCISDSATPVPASSIGGSYDPSADKWSTWPPSPLGPRCNPASVWTGKQLIVWSGNSGSKYFDDGAIFDPATKTWTSMAKAPIPARSTAAAVWSPATQEMLVFGGFPSASMSDAAAYHPATDTWRLLAKAPGVGRAATATTWTRDRWIVYGGLGAGGKYLVDAISYDPITNTWSPLTPPSSFTAYLDVAFASSPTQAFFFSGATATLSEPSIDRGIVYDAMTSIWTEVPAGPLSQRWRSTGWFGEGRFYVWGGETMSADGLSDGAAYDPSLKIWTKVPDGGPSKRYFHVGVWAAGEAIVWGGRGPGSLNDGKIYRP